ncbi:hypothetical protein MNEG_16199, partial [Monoraphidium neglectum]
MLATIVSSQQRRGRPHSSDLGGALPALVFAPGVANPLLLAANTSEAAALGGAKAARAGALAASGAYAALEAALGGTDVFSYPVHLWCFSQAVAGLGGAGDPHKQHCFLVVVQPALLVDRSATAAAGRALPPLMFLFDPFEGADPRLQRLGLPLPHGVGALACRSSAGVKEQGAINAVQQDPSGSEGVLRAAPASAAPPAPLPRPPTEAALLAAAARGSMKLRAVVDRGLGHLPDPRAVSPGGSLDALAALLSLLGHLSEDFLRQPIAMAKEACTGAAYPFCQRLLGLALAQDGGDPPAPRAPRRPLGQQRKAAEDGVGAGTPRGPGGAEKEQEDGRELAAGSSGEGADDKNQQGRAGRRQQQAAQEQQQQKQQAQLAGQRRRASATVASEPPQKRSRSAAQPDAEAQLLANSPSADGSGRAESSRGGSGGAQGGGSVDTGGGGGVGARGGSGGGPSKGAVVASAKGAQVKGKGKGQGLSCGSCRGCRWKKPCEKLQ